MAERVLVRNYGQETYEEKYDEELISIPPNGTIEMQRRDAKKFLGTYSGMDPKTEQPKIKMLRVEPYEAQAEKVEDVEKFVSNVNGEEFDSQEALDAHLKANAGKLYSDPVVEERLKKR